MPRPFPSLFLPLLLLLLLPCPDVWSYEAPLDKQDVFAGRACPALLSFINVAYLAGVTVELSCRCKPHQVQTVVWFFRKHRVSSKETRALTDYHGNMLLDPSHVPHSGTLQSRFTIRLFSLLVFRASPDDTGIYICGSTHNDFFYGYDLDIQEARTINFAPRLTPETTSKEVKPRKGPSSASTLYRVFNRFQPWSVCDRCGVPGEHTRVGLCYVDSRYLHVRYRWVNQTVASCGSGGVVRAFGELKQGATLEVKSCQVACPSQDPPNPKIQGGKSFLGHNSDSSPVEAPVFYLSHPADRVLTLGCPDARPNMAVAWDRGSNALYRSEHSAGVSASPRLLIDTGHHLVFNPAETQDSGVYYCWLQGHKAAEIRLLVYAHFGSGQSVTSHPEFQSAVNTVLTSYAAMVAVFILLQMLRSGIRHLRDTGETCVD